MFRNRKALLFGALLFYLYFRGAGDHGLIDPLEGINASIALHMSAGGNNFIPKIGSAFTAGRTLGTWWLESLALHIFGWSEFAVRFWSALSGLIMIWASSVAARPLSDPNSLGTNTSTRSSWLAASICAAMTLCFTVSQLASPHAIYSCLMALTMTGIIRSSESKRWLFAAHVASSFCFIAYGFEGLFLVWIAVLAYSVLSNDTDILRDFFTWPPGIIFTLSLSGLYFVVLLIVNTDIIQFMHCQVHTYSFGGLTGMLLFGFVSFVPFHGFIIRAFYEIFPTEYPSEKTPEVFMLVWTFVFGVAAVASGDMLSLSCCVPAVSAILGRRLELWLTQRSMYELRVSVMLNTLILVPAIVFIPFMMTFPVVRASMLSLVPWVMTTVLFLFACWYYTKTRQVTKWTRNVPGAALLCLMPLAGIFSLTAEIYSVRDLGVVLRDSVQGNDRVIQYGVNYPSVYFYSFRNSIIVDAELSPGVMEKSFVTNEERISSLWEGKERVFMIVPTARSTNKTIPRNIFSLIEADGMLLLSNQKNK